MLRDFLPADFDAAVELIHACGLGHAPNDPERDLERILAAPASRIFVFDENGSVAGLVVAANDGRRGWIYYLAVSHELRQRGIGQALLHHAEEWLRSCGVPKVLLLVRDTNLKVMEFYRSFGYQEEPCTCMGHWIAEPIV